MRHLFLSFKMKKKKQKYFAVISSLLIMSTYWKQETKFLSDFRPFRFSVSCVEGMKETMKPKRDIHFYRN